MPMPASLKLRARRAELIAFRASVAAVVYFLALLVPSAWAATSYQEVTVTVASGVSYTIAASAWSATGSGLFPQATTPAATLNLTTGDTLLVFATDCEQNGNCSSGANAPAPASVSVSAGSIGSCTTPAGSGVPSWDSLYLEVCPILQGATNVDVTVNYSPNVIYSQIYAIDVNRSPPATLTDEGLGSGYWAGFVTSVSIGPMTPTQSYNFVIACLSSPLTGKVLTPGSGFTALPIALDSAGDQALLVEYMITTNSNPVTATATLSPADDIRFDATILH